MDWPGIEHSLVDQRPTNNSLSRGVFSSCLRVTSCCCLGGRNWHFGETALQSWRWIRFVLPKCLYIPTKLHGAIHLTIILRILLCLGTDSWSKNLFLGEHKPSHCCLLIFVVADSNACVSFYLLWLTATRVSVSICCGWQQRVCQFLFLVADSNVCQFLFAVADSNMCVSSLLILRRQRLTRQAM
jgi:hypothetical protein